jgi:hypothetical protein
MEKQSFEGPKTGLGGSTVSAARKMEISFHGLNIVILGLVLLVVALGLLL